jgi:hypothetical protein
MVEASPAFLVVLQDAIESTDLALIPLKASALDLMSSEDAVHDGPRGQHRAPVRHLVYSMVRRNE